jgi:hypothetical protein
MSRQPREDCPEGPNCHLHLRPLTVAGCVLLVAAALGRGSGTFRSGLGEGVVVLLLAAAVASTVIALRHSDWTTGGG